MRVDLFEQWYAKTVELEGKVNWLYLDCLGLCTVGVGNLVDPIGLALALPWKLAGDDGHALPNVPAAAHEVSIAWAKVKGAQSMKLLGGGHPRWGQLTDLRLTDADIQHLVRTKLEQNETFLRARFPDYDTWPDNVTMAVNSLAWACGPAFAFPKLVDALNARDWHECAKQCHIEDSHNPGVRPRNRWMVELFDAAVEIPPPPSTQPEPVGSVVDPDEIEPGDGPTVLDAEDLHKRDS